ncbi:MAG: sigma-70 family RNA polymerase sigma factor [Verrucomicrobia bacterium]|nr:sigma-70 family RNA polymerase sigma factor [Verrucomicrobiota bacterium]
MNRSPSTVPVPAADAVLVQAALRGDTEAFRELVLRHQHLVLGVALTVLGQRQLAEDAAQDAFVHAWRSLPALRDPARFRPWVVGISRNLARNLRRARTRDPLRPTGDLPQTPAEGTDPADAAVSREEEAAVFDLISKLPEDYRETLVLYYAEGRSTAAVATALDISEDAVRQRLTRGRRLLQDRVLNQVEGTLGRRSLGTAFAVAVLALLPAPSAPAAVIGGSMLPLAAGAVAGSAGLALGSRLGWIGAAAGCGCGLMGGWLGARAAFAQARNTAQRRGLITMTLLVGILALGFVAALWACTFNFPTLLAVHPMLPWAVGRAIGYAQRLCRGFDQPHSHRQPAFSAGDVDPPASRDSPRVTGRLQEAAYRVPFCAAGSVLKNA